MNDFSKGFLSYLRRDFCIILETFASDFGMLAVGVFLVEVRMLEDEN